MQPIDENACSVKKNIWCNQSLRIEQVCHTNVLGVPINIHICPYCREEHFLIVSSVTFRPRYNNMCTKRRSEMRRQFLT